VSRSLERLARNQVLFRDVNERISQLGRSGGATEYLCECTDEACTATIELEDHEYEGIRSGGNLFLILPGHEDEAVDHVLEKNDRFYLVEKKAGVRLSTD
jgi:hypothetical protein